MRKNRSRNALPKRAKAMDGYENEYPSIVFSSTEDPGKEKSEKIRNL